MEIPIGKVIKEFRIQKELSQNALARGIVSVPELSRLENEEKEIDKVIIEALLQRLGKSYDKFELQMSSMEYKVFLGRQMLVNSLLEDEEAFEDYLQQYEKLADLKKSLHQQFYLMIKASAEYVFHNDLEKCKNLLERAMETTFEKWKKESWNEIILCTQELQVLILISYCCVEQNQLKEAEELLGKIYEYCHTRMEDEEEFMRVCPPICFLLAKKNAEDNEKEGALSYIQQGKELLAQNGNLTLMKDFLKLEMELGKNDVVERQLEAFGFVEELVGISYEDNIFVQLVQLNQHKKIVLTGELVKNVRSHRNITQEELSSEICDKETLSRIETGRRRANRRNLEALYEKLELEQSLYHSRLATNQYGLLEKARDCGRAQYKKEWELGRQLIAEIEQQVDMTNPINIQYVENNKIIYLIVTKQLEMEEANKRLNRLLAYTWREELRGIYRIPNRNEFHIILQIAINNKELKRYEESEALYAKLLERYEATQVLIEHHAREMLLLYENYSILLEVSNKLEEAEVMARKGFELAYRCKRGDWIGTILANFSCVYEKRPNETHMQKMCLYHSYWLYLLYKHEKDAQVVRSIYEKTFGGLEVIPFI